MGFYIIFDGFWTVSYAGIHFSVDFNRSTGNPVSVIARNAESLLHHKLSVVECLELQEFLNSLRPNGDTNELKSYLDSWMMEGESC